MSADQEAAGNAASSSTSNAIAKSAGRGLRWSLTASLATKIGSFAMGLVLARLLAPADFGLYAIALAATGFVMHVNDVGLIAATVQWRGRLSEVAPTAATLAAVFSAVVYAIFWLGAPGFAALAGNPDAAPVVRLLTAVILIDGITAIRVAALQRRFQQEKLAVANMFGFTVQAPVTIVLAVNGAGAYSFAGGQVAQSVVTGVLVFIWARVPVKIGVDREVAGKLMRYGIPLAASLGVEALLMNADFVIVGRIMGAAELGFYLLAFNVSSWVANTLGTAIRYVSVPGFSRLSEEDGALSDGVQRAVPLLLIGVLPIATMMGVLSAPLVTFLYGERWAHAAAALTFLMVMAVVRLVAGLALDVLMGSGATRASLWVNVGWAIGLVPALIVGTLLDGIRGAALGHVAAGLLVAIPLSGMALHRAGVHLAPIGPAVARPLIAAALAGGAALVAARAVGDSAFLQLAAGGTTGLVVYLLAGFSRAQLVNGGTRVLRSARHRRAEATSVHVA